MEPLPLTRQGFAATQAERDALGGELPGLLARLHAARDLGDVGEKNDLHGTRERLAQVRARLAARTADLDRAQLVTAPADTQPSAVGSAHGPSATSAPAERRRWPGGQRRRQPRQRAARPPGGGRDRRADARRSAPAHHPGHPPPGGDAGRVAGRRCTGAAAR